MISFFQVPEVEKTNISKLAPSLAFSAIGKRDGIIPKQLPGAWTSLGCYTSVQITLTCSETESVTDVFTARLAVL
jgi:hypothetical protein